MGDAISSVRLLVSDIDGTLLDRGRPTVGLSSLRALLQAYRHQVKLVYATGRSLESTLELVRGGVLPEPDAIAGFVGTEIGLAPGFEPLEEWAEQIAAGWNRSRAVAVALSFPRVRSQPERFQSPLKASFYLDAPEVVPVLERALAAQRAGARVIYSCDRYLDLIPAAAGKRNAAEHLRARFHIPQSGVLTAGDSGNDLDMLLDGRFHGVAVGNAEQELRGVVKAEHLHASDLPHAAGVLEGAEAFQFWTFRS